MKIKFFIFSIFFLLISIEYFAKPAPTLALYQCSVTGGSCSRCVGGPWPDECSAECDYGWKKSCGPGEEIAEKCTASCDCGNNTEKCFKCRDIPTPTPTVTPTPPRQYLCQTASTSKIQMQPGDKTILRSKINDPNQVMKQFLFAFYNMDNLYPSPPINNPKPLCVLSGGDYNVQTNGCPKVNNVQSYQLIYRDLNPTDSGTDGYRELFYENIFRADENNTNKIPEKVHFNAYFIDQNNQTSNVDQKCMADITRITLVTPTPTRTPTITPTKPPPTRTPTRTPTPPGGCVNYGIDEYSQGDCFNVLKIDLSNNTIERKQTYYCKTQNICDGESMDNYGSTPYLFAAKDKPAIYTVKPDGSLVTKIGLKVGKHYEGITFRKQDNNQNTIWGGSLNNGIDKINLLTGSIIKSYPGTSMEIKSMVWDNSGTYLYVSQRTADRCTRLQRFYYDSAKDTLTKQSFDKSMPGCTLGRTDAMDMTTDGYIVGGYKSGQNLIFYFCDPLIDATSCKQVSYRTISLSSYNAALSTNKICAQSFINLDGFTWMCGKKP